MDKLSLVDAGWILEKFRDTALERLLQYIDHHRLQNLISDYDVRFKHQLESAAHEEELDFGGLQLYIEKELKRTIIPAIQTPNAEDRARKKVRIVQEACQAAAANNDSKISRVTKYMDVLFDFVAEIAQNRVDANTKTFVNTAIDVLDEKHSKNQKALRREIRRLRRLPQKKPFADMVDRIGEKRTSENEFHYLNNSIGFWGRDEEIKALNNFLKDDRKILFMSIVGPGASGKSKLVYEFYKQHRHDPNWAVKYIDKPEIERLLTFDDYSYPKNLVLIVDYAGLYARHLGSWLKYLRSLTDQAFSKKIRLILLERSGMIRTELFTMPPRWHQDLLHSGEQSADLKDIWYHAACFGPIGELKPLPGDALRQIMAKYATDHGASVSDEGLELLMTCLGKIDAPHGYASRPLFALLLAEAYVDHHDIRKWDSVAIVEHCIARNQKQWRYLCGDNEELYNVVQTAVLHATATEGLDADRLPNPIRQLDDDAFLRLISGINQESQFHGVLYPMEPDIVGEYFLIHALMKAACRKDRLQQQAADYWVDTQNFFSVLARCIHDYCHNAVFAKFLREHADLLLPPDRNDLEIEAHSRLLHMMLVKFKGKTNQDIFAGKIKALYEKYPQHTIVIGDYAASLMLEFRNHIQAPWEQEVNVETIRRLHVADPENSYLYMIYGKSIFNQISGYCQHLLVHNSEPMRAHFCPIIAQHYQRLKNLASAHPDFEQLQKSLEQADFLIKTYWGITKRK